MNLLIKTVNRFLLIFVFFIGTSGIVVEKTTIEELTNSSSLIVYGKIKEKRCFWEGKQINTYLILQVYDVIKGEVSTEEVTIKQMGGTIGAYSDEIDGQPIYEPGNEVVFFLIDWKGNYKIHSIAVGGYSIVKTGGETYAVNKFNDITFNEPLAKRQGEELKSEYVLSEMISKITRISAQN